MTSNEPADKGEKKVIKEKDSTAEVFKANKMNPQLYTDQVNRNEKKRMREERHEKNKLGKNDYI